MAFAPDASRVSWSVLGSFSDCGVEAIARPDSRRKFAKGLCFLNWGRPPPANTKCSWMPHGNPAFDKPIQFPDGLELQLQVDGKDFVARTSVGPGSSGSANPLLYWEILELDSESGLLSPRVRPTPGPAPGPAFKALFSDLGKGDSAYRKWQVRGSLGFNDVLVLAHIDHAFHGCRHVASLASGHLGSSRTTWTPPATFFLDHGKFLSFADQIRLTSVDEDLRRYVKDLIPPDDENTNPSPPLHTPTPFANVDVVQRLMLMGREGQVLNTLLQRRDENVQQAPSATGPVRGLGIQRLVPQCEQVLQDYLDRGSLQAAGSVPYHGLQHGLHLQQQGAMPAPGLQAGGVPLQGLQQQGAMPATPAQRIRAGGEPLQGLQQQGAMPATPARATPAPGLQAGGVPLQGLQQQGVMPATPAPATPAPGIQAGGVPLQGLQQQGVMPAAPAPGLQAGGVPLQGLQQQGVMPAAPAPGLQARGVPLQCLQQQGVMPKHPDRFGPS